MALPTSPPIDMLQIYAEFGGSGQPLTAFVRGGAYVPNITANNNIPTAPPLNLLQFLGARKSSVVLPASMTWSALGSSSLTIGTTNTLTYGGSGAFTWNPAGEPQSNFRFRLVTISGTPPTTGTAGTLYTPGVSNIVYDWLSPVTYRGTLQITDSSGNVITSSPVNLN